MAQCTGIIAEYNPFHNGHKYHIEMSKKLNGNRPIIVAMSGWFVQRGDVAAFDPYVRTKWALENGADIVLMLPVTFSMSHAERFAFGGVSLLESTGMVDSLSFGAECEDVSLISRLAETINSESCEYKSALTNALNSGKSFPAARSEALCRILGPESAALLSSPNNILGIEYLNAIKKIKSDIKPMAIKRVGAEHDSLGSKNGLMSASAIRSEIRNGNSWRITQMIPDGVFSDISSLTMLDIKKLSQSVIYALRRLSVEEIASLPDVSEGLENTIYAACRNSSDFNELTASIKSKRYTLARIRRICLNALLGITKQDYVHHAKPEFIRVLGVRRDSLSLLSELTQKASLPIVTCRADYDKLNPSAKEAFNKDIFASEAAQINSSVISDFKRKLIIV